MSEVSAAFTGIALELWPNPDFSPRRVNRSIRLSELVGRVTGLWQSLSQALALAAALEVFTIISPLFLQWVIDHVLVAAKRDLLTLLGLGFCLLVLLQQSIGSLRSWVLMHFGTALNVQWHANTFSHLLSLPVSYFEKRHLGDVISRFRSIDVIQRTLTTAFIEAVMDGVMTLVMLVVLYLYDPLLTYVCLAATVLYTLCRWLWYQPLRLATEEQIVYTAKQESHLLESVRGISSIKMFQRQNERCSHWLALLVEQVNAGLKAQKLQIFFKLAHGLLYGLENVAVIWLGAGLVLDGRLSAGMLVAFMAYKGQFSTRISALIDRLYEVKVLQVQGERLADIVMTEPEKPSEAARLVAMEAAVLEPSLELRAVSFKYAEHEPYVLAGVNLKVEAGESVVIVGASGCGKTTLLRLMLGVLQPSVGRVFIGGIDLAHIGMETLRRAVSCVAQHDTLFAGSIADNISFFDSQSDQERIERCARHASIHAEIAEMPMAYNTRVGHMGSTLSGGQQQRILLARALYKRPRLLILDEATSHLDIKREIMVNASIRALNITRIVVAHRPQTAESADRVLTLAGGRIVRESRITPNISALHKARVEPMQV